MSVILQGMIIGMVVVFPIGPLGIITTQRAINFGWKRGFFSGVGAAISDMFYSTGAVFGLSYIHDFIISHRALINKLIGLVFLIIGVSILVNAIKNRHANEYKENSNLHPALSHFLLGFSNPFTLLIFLFIFSRWDFGFDTASIFANFTMVLSIFGGAVLFWFVATNLLCRLRDYINIKRLYQFNQVIGSIIAAFGLFYLIKGFFGL